MDVNGRKIDRGGEAFDVSINGPRLEYFDINDHDNGTYSVRYRFFYYLLFTYCLIHSLVYLFICSLFIIIYLLIPLVNKTF